MTRMIRRTTAAWIGLVLTGALLVLAASARTGRAQIIGNLVDELPTAWDIPIPVVSAGSVLHLSGTYFCATRLGACRPPEFALRLRLMNSKGFFDVFTNNPVTVMANKKTPGVYMLSADVSLAGTNGLIPGWWGAAGLTLSVAAPAAARRQLTAGVFVEETSAVGNPLFQSYVTWLAEPRPDPIFQLMFQFP